jgi:hypothetical protein
MGMYIGILVFLIALGAVFLVAKKYRGKKEGDN